MGVARLLLRLLALLLSPFAWIQHRMDDLDSQAFERYGRTDLECCRLNPTPHGDHTSPCGCTTWPRTPGTARLPHPFVESTAGNTMYCPGGV